MPTVAATLGDHLHLGARGAIDLYADALAFGRPETKVDAAARLNLGPDRQTANDLRPFGQIRFPTSHFTQALHKGA